MLAFITLASAQTTEPQRQIEQLIGSLIIANTNAQAQIADLKRQLEEAKKPVPEAPGTPAK